MGVETIFCIIRPDNYGAVSLVRKMGFTVKSLEDGAVKGVLNLKEEESRFQREKPENVMV